eukprot:8643678-Pyramimonas_sp.AAC.1
MMIAPNLEDPRASHRWQGLPVVEGALHWQGQSGCGLHACHPYPSIQARHVDPDAPSLNEPALLTVKEGAQRLAQAGRDKPRQ